MRKLLILCFVLIVAPRAIAAAGFDDFFIDKTMRVNYFHTGGTVQETIALDSVVSDGPWPGSRTRLLDTLNLGNYDFEVIDRATNQPIYTRGFASVFGEWITTDEAKQRAGAASRFVARTSAGCRAANKNAAEAAWLICVRWYAPQRPYCAYAVRLAV